MSSYENRFLKIRVVFHALYFENEVGDPPFFCLFDMGNSLSDCSKSMTKICFVEDFRANVLKRANAFFYQSLPSSYKLL